jgi:hypothetical protein
MKTPTMELIPQYLPGVKLRTSSEGNWAGYDSRKSQKMLGFNARHLVED